METYCPVALQLGERRDLFNRHCDGDGVHVSPKPQEVVYACPPPAGVPCVLPRRNHSCRTDDKRLPVGLPHPVGAFLHLVAGAPGHHRHPRGRVFGEPSVTPRCTTLSARRRAVPPVDADRTRRFPGLDLWVRGSPYMRPTSSRADATAHANGRRPRPGSPIRTAVAFGLGSD
jgi:hypothetical protein